MLFIVVCKGYKEIPTVEVCLAAETLFAVVQIVQLTFYALRNIHFCDLLFGKQSAQAVMDIVRHGLFHFSVAQALIIALREQIVKENIKGRASAAKAFIRRYINAHGSIMLAALVVPAFIAHKAVIDDLFLLVRIFFRTSAAGSLSHGFSGRSLRMATGRSYQMTAVIIGFIRFRRVVEKGKRTTL